MARRGEWTSGVRWAGEAELPPGRRWEAGPREASRRLCTMIELGRLTRVILRSFSFYTSFIYLFINLLLFEKAALLKFNSTIQSTYLKCTIQQLCVILSI